MLGVRVLCWRVKVKDTVAILDFIDDQINVFLRVRNIAEKLIRLIIDRFMSGQPGRVLERRSS